jgi:hypothetical protein
MEYPKCEKFKVGATFEDCTNELKAWWNTAVWGEPTNIRYYNTGRKFHPVAVAWQNYELLSDIDVYNHMFNWTRVESE